MKRKNVKREEAQERAKHYKYENSRTFREANVEGNTPYKKRGSVRTEAEWAERNKTIY